MMYKRFKLKKKNVLLLKKETKPSKIKNFSIIFAYIVAPVDSHVDPVENLGSISEYQIFVHNNDTQEIKVENKMLTYPKPSKSNNCSIISNYIVAPVDLHVSPLKTMGSISEDQKSVYKNDVQEKQVENKKLTLLEKSPNLLNATIQVMKSKVMKDQFVNGTIHYHILDTCSLEKFTIM